MANDFARELKRLATGGATALRPVYALVSEEPLLVREAVAALRAHVLTTAPDFNRDELTGGEARAERVTAAATTLPMMATHRWVHLSSVHRLKVADQAGLLPYLAKPVASTVLCLSGEKLDGRAKLGATLKTMDALFVLTPPKAYQVADWILARTRGLDLAIDKDAAHLLADLMGVDLGGIDMALAKLTLFAGEGAAITSEHVEEAVAPTRVASVFELTDAIGRRDHARASLTLRNALTGGESALLVLTMIARHLRHLIEMKELHAAGAPSHAMARALGVQPFLVDKLTKQAAAYQTRELCAAIAAIHAADLRLKSSGLDATLVLDRLLVEIMEQRESPS